MNLSSSLGIGAAAYSAAAAMPPVVMVRKRRDDRASCSHLRTGLEFSMWANEQSRFPNIDAVCTSLNAYRSTAYRWPDSLAAAHGVAPPPHSGEETR